MPPSKDWIIDGRYKMGSKIGWGAFGEIWEAFDMQTKQKVAVKLEQMSIEHPQPATEYNLYQMLNGTSKLCRHMTLCL